MDSELTSLVAVVEDAERRLTAFLAADAAWHDPAFLAALADRPQRALRRLYQAAAFLSDWPRTEPELSARFARSRTTQLALEEALSELAANETRDEIWLPIDRLREAAEVEHAVLRDAVGAFTTTHHGLPAAVGDWLQSNLRADEAGLRDGLQRYRRRRAAYDELERRRHATAPAAPPGPPPAARSGGRRAAPSLRVRRALALFGLDDKVDAAAVRARYEALTATPDGGSRHGAQARRQLDKAYDVLRLWFGA